MTYKVTLRNADTAWEIDQRTVETFVAAIQLTRGWFREFHEPIVEEWGVRPGLVNLPVTVSIEKAGT